MILTILVLCLQTHSNASTAARTVKVTGAPSIAKHTEIAASDNIDASETM